MQLHFAYYLSFDQVLSITLLGQAAPRAMAIIVIIVIILFTIIVSANFQYRPPLLFIDDETTAHACPHFECVPSHTPVVFLHGKTGNV